LPNSASADLRWPNAPSWMRHLPLAATTGLARIGDAVTGFAGAGFVALGFGAADLAVAVFAGGLGAAGFFAATIDCARAMPFCR
jgi:hypothetical protein